MLFVFAFLSLFTPAFFLQSRLIDSPFITPAGMRTICIAKTCIVYPAIGTSHSLFISSIPTEKTGIRPTKAGLFCLSFSFCYASHRPFFSQIASFSDTPLRSPAGLCID